MREKKVKAIVASMRGALFVDAGTNQGVYAQLARKNFGRVVTIDPNPRWKADLPIALSDNDGHAPFYVGDNYGSADSLVENPHVLGQVFQNSRKFDVETKRWDTLNLDADLVKIDVEGAEFKVLAGMVERLPKNMIIEVHDERRKHELLKVAVSKGYRPHRIDSNHWLFSLEK